MHEMTREEAVATRRTQWASTTKDEPIRCEFTIAIDTREQMPYQFQGFFADAKHKHRPLIIPTERQTLATGDYSIVGLEHVVAIERKSLADLYQSCGRERARFEREIERMQALRWAAIVVEASWLGVLTEPSETEMHRKSVWRSLIAWQCRGIHVWCCDTRQLCERTVFRALERIWLDREQGKGFWK